MELDWHAFIIIVLVSVVGCNPKQTSFEFVVLPDTQSYMEEHPEIYLDQMEWIAKNKQRFSFVLHQGDITQNNSDKEWEIAKEGFDMIEGEVPFSFSLGNHDMGSAAGKFADIRNTQMVNKYFKFEELKAKSNVLASFPNGSVDNLCSLFNIAGYQWLVFSLEFGPRNSTIEWVDSIIEDYPEAKIIVNTHAYLYEDSSWQSDDDWWQPQAYGIGKDIGEEAVNNGKQLWDKLIKKYPNMMMVFCGHVLKSGVGTLVSEGVHGNKVYQMLANYQKGVDHSKNGGNGFLRIIKVDTQNKSISVSTYSPWLDAYKEDITHDFNFENIKL